MKTFEPRSGDWVVVRSKEEILTTLDGKGELDGMPFMPEMFAYCGQRFRVFKRAHKTCDTVFPIRGRRVADAVHLETRCDGQAHGGCQAGCLIFWKTAWLAPAGPDGKPTVDNSPAARSPEASTCTEEHVQRATVDPASGEGTNRAYVCQATRLPYFTTSLNWWQPAQYVEDFTSGNEGLGRMISGFCYMFYNGVMNSGLKVGAPMRWLYDAWQKLRGGVPYPRRSGSIPAGQPTPGGSLNLQPGEWVRVRPYEEILATLDTNNRNRGLFFDAEMVPYCGKTYKVLKRVTKILDEKTGKMLEMKNPCIILDDVYCRSAYSECRMFCPRAIYSYWRELWLERISPDDAVRCDRDAACAKQ